MPPFEDKPFRSKEESNKEPSQAFIRMSHPQVRAHVVPAAGKAGELTKGDFVTSFLVAWQPSPTPPAHWVELLRKAPFGTQAIRAGNLHWDGHSFSVELFNESDVESFAIEMPDWVEFAKAEFGRRVHTPAEDALAEGQKRAEALEHRFHR